MSGYYKYSDIFQITESKMASSIQGGKYLDIEYNESYASSFRSKPIDDRARERVHLDFLKELISLLSIATNQYYEIDFDKKFNIRPPSQEGIDAFSDISLSREIRRSPNRVSQRQNYTMSFVSIHPDADDFFKNYFRLSAEARSRFNASIFLYQGMRKILLTSASMAVIGLISAIENLMDFEGKKIQGKTENCQTCSQPIHSISKKFKAFMLRFSQFDVDNKNKLLSEFYSKRSKISHAGGILEIDRLLSKFSMEEHREFTEIESHVRIALFNYLLNYDFSNEQERTEPVIT